MSRITRESFIDSMGGGEAGLDVQNLDGALLAAIGAAGIGPAELEARAGADHVIAGGDELSRLFDLVDRVDRDGSYDSLATTRRGADGVALTASGELVRALRNEVERARLGQGNAVEASCPDSALPRATLRPSSERYAEAISSLEERGFTGIHLAPNVPYFNQADPAWGSHPFPKNPPEPGVDRTIQNAGCAPTALAMVDAALRRSDTTPDEVADFAVAAGLSGSSYGADAVAIGKAWAEVSGLTFTPAEGHSKSEQLDVLCDQIAAGGIGIVSVGRGHFTNRGHILVVNGCAIDGNGQQWFFVINPGQRDQTKRGVDDTVVQDSSFHHGAGRVRISREQLAAEMKYAFALSGGDR